MTLAPTDSSTVVLQVAASQVGIKGKFSYNPERGCPRNPNSAILCRRPRHSGGIPAGSAEPVLAPPSERGQGTTADAALHGGAVSDADGCGRHAGHRPVRAVRPDGPLHSGDRFRHGQTLQVTSRTPGAHVPGNGHRLHPVGTGPAGHGQTCG